MNLCDQLALFTGTDKSSQFHNYTDTYERYFRARRKEVKSLLEIGVWHGESVALWKQYFPNALIVGIDVDPECKQFEDDRVKIIIGNATKPLNFPIDVYERLIGERYTEQSEPKTVQFDIIIDDGSHRWNQVIESFELLFQYIRPGGYYVIEDTLCSYVKDFRSGIHNPVSPVEYFKKICDEINFMGFKGETYACSREYLMSEAARLNFQIGYWTRHIRSISFHTGLIFIEKI